MKTHVANHHYQVNGISYIDEGYCTWKYISNKFYFLKNITLPWVNFKKSVFWRNGYSIHDNAITTELCDKIINSNIDSKAISMISSLLSNWQSKYLPKGLHIIPYRSHIYNLPKDIKSASCFWHYDVEQPENSIYFLIYLDNDCQVSQNPGGTYIIDALNSAALSISTGYISSPIENRAAQLNCIDPNIKIEEVFVKANKGRMLSFMPSRCLHKGLPSSEDGFKRTALHISAQVFDSDNQEQIEDLNTQKFRTILATSFNERMQNCGYPLPLNAKN